MKDKRIKILNEIASIYDIDQWDDQIDSSPMAKNIAKTSDVIKPEYDEVLKKVYFRQSSYKDVIMALYKNWDKIGPYFYIIFPSAEILSKYLARLNQQFINVIQNNNNPLFWKPADDEEWNLFEIIAAEEISDIGQVFDYFKFYEASPEKNALDDLMDEFEKNEWSYTGFASIGTGGEEDGPWPCIFEILAYHLHSFIIYQLLWTTLNGTDMSYSSTLNDIMNVDSGYITYWTINPF